MKKFILFICVSIGLIFLINTADAQNDSIWITNSGGTILSVGHRANDTTATLGWIRKEGDVTTICSGSSITLTIQSSYAVIHHVSWVPNQGPALATPNAFSITVNPIVNTDYAGYVYEDVLGTAVYRGMVKISVMLAPDPPEGEWMLDGVADGDTAHYCGGGEIMQYANTQVGAIYQLMDWNTNLPVGPTTNGNGGTIDLPSMPLGIYYMYIDNGICSIFNY